MAPYSKAKRLVECIKAVVGPAAAERITEALELPQTSWSPKRKARWAREVTLRLDALLPEAERREIMERRQCRVPKGRIERDKALWQRCASLEEFARAKREAGWKEFLCEGNTLRMRIAAERCHCGLVLAREEPISKTYCHCCAGHIRSGLQPVFEQRVDVEPVSTLISGDAECWFAAHVGGKGAMVSTPRRGDP